MKKNIYVLVFLFVLILIVSLRFYYVENKAKEYNKVQLIGEYELDIGKTNFESYSNGKKGYQSLKLFVNKDMTFSFNESVPFIYDKAGTWQPAVNTLGDWNKFYFKVEGKGKIEAAQVDNCCLSDGSLSIIAMKPQKGQKAINELFFMKIRKVDSLFSQHRQCFLKFIICQI
jgi:hypothetical protein